eukprot:8939667-Pyramimonas_sp.AAC.1
MNVLNHVASGASSCFSDVESLDDGGADVVINLELPSTGLIDSLSGRVRVLIICNVMSHSCPLNTSARVL